MNDPTLLRATRVPVPPREWSVFVERALEAIPREYPHHVVHLMNGDPDARPPRELAPVFHGCFDWHSAVHSHWCVVRALHRGLEGDLAERATALLHGQFEPRRLAGEIAYLAAPGRAGFERPYGLAWLLQLAAELRAWESVAAFAWLDALGPLEALAVERLSGWLPRLGWPVRTGEHGQTAFAMGLALDWSRAAGDRNFERLLIARARDFHDGDRDAPIAYEPSGQDFLSPALAEADLMRRVLDASEYDDWLARFLPDPVSPAAVRWLTPVEATDRTDGKLAHLDGLNLSRAWMLEGIASATRDDARRGRWLEAAERHAVAGVAAAVASEHYAGTHWLGSFATYLLTRRGVGV